MLKSYTRIYNDMNEAQSDCYRNKFKKLIDIKMQFTYVIQIYKPTNLEQKTSSILRYVKIHYCHKIAYINTPHAK